MGGHDFVDQVGGHLVWAGAGGVGDDLGQAQVTRVSIGTDPGDVGAKCRLGRDVGFKLGQGSGRGFLATLPEQRQQIGFRIIPAIRVDHDGQRHRNE